MLFSALKVYWQWRKLDKEIERRKPMQYSVWKTVWKGLLSGLKTSAALAGAAALPVLLGFWSDPTQVTAALVAGGVDPKIIVPLVPLITMGLTMVNNWWKNRNKSA